jgi:hypothetical protein
MAAPMSIVDMVLVLLFWVCYFFLYIRPKAIARALRADPNAPEYRLPLPANMSETLTPPEFIVEGGEGMRGDGRG